MPNNSQNTLSRRQFLTKALAAGAAGFLGASCSRILLVSKAATTEKPNFLIFLIDDMGWMDLACQGSEFYETPNIDRFAKQGMTFTNAYAASPLCSPTRASILTGKNPARLHITSAITYKKKVPDDLPAEEKGPQRPWWKLTPPGRLRYLPLEETTIAEELKRDGYTSCMLGKWHLGKEDYYPEKQGFDLNIAGGHYPSPPSYFSPYKIKTIEDGEKGEYLTDRLTDEAETFLETNKDRPFLLHFCHYAVHGPWQAKENLTEKYKEKIDPESGQKDAVYAAMIHSVDDSVGRIMKKLDELDLAKNTAVFFVSDNGGVLVKGQKNGPRHITSNAPLRGGKAMIYEGGIRVPMFVRWPGKVKAGSVCDTPVVTDDFYPTLLELAGLHPSEKKILDGESIVPLIRETGGLKRDYICFHFPHYLAGYRPDSTIPTHKNTPSSAIRQGDFKLIEFYEGWVELYNLKDDIGETTNIAGGHPELVKELRKKLADWLKETGAWLPVANPAYDPSIKKIPGKK